MFAFHEQMVVVVVYVSDMIELIWKFFHSDPSVPFSLVSSRIADEKQFDHE